MSFMQEAVREWTYNVGRDNHDREWLLSDYDTWERNPFYTGTPGRHPEDYDYEDSDVVENDEFDELDDVTYVAENDYFDDVPF